MSILVLNGQVASPRSSEAAETPRLGLPEEAHLPHKDLSSKKEIL